MEILILKNNYNAYVVHPFDTQPKYMKFNLDIFTNLARVLLMLTSLCIIASCSKEEPQPHFIVNPLDKITPYPGWEVVELNEDYYLQFPKGYKGTGYAENCFEKMNPDEDLSVFHCYCDDYSTFICVGDTLTVPLPSAITRLPYVLSSSLLTLNRKERLYTRDTIESGILYYSVEDETSDDPSFRDGLYYKKVDDQYISMLLFQYHWEKSDTVQMICKSIEKK